MDTINYEVSQPGTCLSLAVSFIECLVRDARIDELLQLLSQVVGLRICISLCSRALEEVLHVFAVAAQQLLMDEPLAFELLAVLNGDFCFHESPERRLTDVPKTAFGDPYW
jgi:hypothetical protein